MSKFHELEMTSIEGATVAFSSFADQMCLVVNVASK
ncbi:MAG: glutathione peroxidase-family protein [Candidatus Poriferisodalaceae bacterium]|jgi:glutathione peroxidase-family protein